MEYSIVVPLYNEEYNLPLLNKELLEVMQTVGSSYEIIYVDDGSTDRSLEVLKKLKGENPVIKIISFKKNQGQSCALFAGFREAGGEFIITLDADLQNPAREIPRLLKYLPDFDYVAGIRIKRKDSFLKKTSSRIARLARRLILGDITQDTGCALKVFKREILSTTPFFKNFHRFFTFLVRSQGFRMLEIPVEHRPRKRGSSKYSICKRFREGLFDLAGVFWLKRRLLSYETKCKC